MAKAFPKSKRLLCGHQIQFLTFGYSKRSLITTWRVYDENITPDNRTHFHLFHGLDCKSDSSVAQRSQNSASRLDPVLVPLPQTPGI
ncbi:hypothetical protein RRG08_040157 [Elysia crispata]|uniref:Uncharacterized protein n=1 Tax=Elysia crispata TaxID=231223 RepID=A0AAE1CN32_9GAST|nr:hypothetical protein RRG08_040157 [Elysia crispata]